MNRPRLATGLAGGGAALIALGVALTPWLGGRELAACERYGPVAFRGLSSD